MKLNTNKLNSEIITGALRRGFMLTPPVKTEKYTNQSNSTALSTAAAIELANYGFLVNPDSLRDLSVDGLSQVVKSARTVIGADRDMRPIYPGFPVQVQGMSTLDLLFEQILHYWTWGAFLPNYPDVARDSLPLEDMFRVARRLEVVPASGLEGFVLDQLRKIVTDSVAMSVDDRDFVLALVSLGQLSMDEILDIIGDASNGENIQAFVKALLDSSSFTNNTLFEGVAPKLRNVDHLLRVFLVLYSVSNPFKSQYDLAVMNLQDSAAGSVMMDRIPRRIRRLLLTKFGELTGGFKLDRAVARRSLWRNVFRAVHPYDFNVDDTTRRGVDVIHSNIDYRTLNSLVEEGMANGDVESVVSLLIENQPGNLLRRLVAILRLVKTDAQAALLADSIVSVGGKAALTTLISSYNGVLSANDTAGKVIRVAGSTNMMVDRSGVTLVNDDHLDVVVSALITAIFNKLKTVPAPTGPVKVKSDLRVPLVRRDAATSDREMDRGQRFKLDGDSNILRLFGHWNNNQREGGYMDIGVALLDDSFDILAVSTWSSWNNHRAWSTYSGDKFVRAVRPGDSAAEYFDVDLDVVKTRYATASWAVLTVQSYSGWPIDNVDFIAGAMLRSDGAKGEVFEPRSVISAFKPTVTSTQSIPLAVDLRTGEMVWIDSSSGSTAAGQSADDDQTIGTIVYDEISREAFTMGQLARLWADAHNAETVDEPVDRKSLLSLL
jgi:hypothetical protein